MLALTLTVAFGLELVALYAFGLWGAHFGQGFLASILFGGGAPLLVAVFWGVFLSPKAAVQLSPLLQLALKLIAFVLATAALVWTGHSALGTGFGTLVVLVTVVLYGLRPQLEAFYNVQHTRP